MLLWNLLDVPRGGLVVAAQKCEPLCAIQPDDEPRRRATKRSPAVEEQKRPTRRRKLAEPRRIEHEALHAPAVLSVDGSVDVQRGATLERLRLGQCQAQWLGELAEQGQALGKRDRVDDEAEFVDQAEP